MNTSTGRLEVPVEVLWDDNTWHPGYLEHWRKEDDRWLGFVRYSTGVGENRIGWFDQAHLRRLD